MKYKIHHVTEYLYEDSVVLGPHLIRLIPKSTSIQQLITYNINVTPEPSGKTEIMDFFGNRCLSVWFTGNTDKLIVDVSSTVETIPFDPFQFLLDPNWVNLPLRKPIIQTPGQGVLNDIEQEIGVKFGGNTIHVLQLLCNIIYTKIKQVVRPEGDPLEPKVTWRKKEGACRDLAVLFMECCLELGLPSRFVSGYLYHRSEKEQYMHAWVEIYLEGGGWRAMDPTSGLLVEKDHIAVASAPEPVLASPISGSFGGITHLKEMNLKIEMKG